MSFEVIPAIDIRGGLCVRLFQGDYRQETVFSDDPVSVARRWEAAKAPRIHVVDLDGAASGQPENAAAIKAITAAVGVPIEMGGGIRSLSAFERALALGVDRVVLGTAAVEDPELVERIAALHGDKLAVGVDAKDGLVATRGWKTTGQVLALDLVRQMAALGVRRFIYTDISRDGTLTSPNFEATAALAESGNGAIIASGGVATLDHVRRLAALKAEGVIIGRAAYTGAVDIAEAVAAGKREGW